MVFNKLSINSYKKEIENRVKNKNLILIWIEYGIAYRINKTIFLNNNLIKYPTYCESVLDHELRHSKSWTKKDLAMDLVEGDTLKNLKFMFKHPKSFTQLFPFGKINGLWFIDINLIVVYLIVTLILTLIIIYL